MVDFRECDGSCPRFSDVYPGVDCSISVASNATKTRLPRNKVQLKLETLHKKIEQFFPDQKGSSNTKSSEECPVCYIESLELPGYKEIEDCYKGNTDKVRTCDFDDDEFCGMQYYHHREVDLESGKRFPYCHIDRLCRKSFVCRSQQT